MSPVWEPQGDDDGPLSRLIFRDRQGHRIDLATYARLYEDMSYRQVALDRVGTSRVITIWNGQWPYSPDGLGPMFSSIIAREVAPHETEYGHEEWYETEEDAIAGHLRRVAELRHPELMGEP